MGGWEDEEGERGDVKKWAEEGDISKLELLVLQGKSHLLEEMMNQSKETQSFVDKVPQIKEEIRV